VDPKHAPADRVPPTGMGKADIVAFMQRQRRLKFADGTEIAYAVEGEGGDLVLTNGLTTTVNFWERLYARWSREHRVLSWDLPGHGDSSPARSGLSARLEEQAECVVRLMDASSMDAAVQVGWSTGCQVVLETYRRHPDRCRALVLLLGSAGRVLSTTRLGLPGHIIDGLVRRTPAPLFGALMRLFALGARGPGGQHIARALGLIGKATSAHDAARILEHLRHLHTDTVKVMIATAEQHSAWELLPRIQVPVLIVAGERDPFAPAETVGAVMHSRCPRSELLRLPGGTHTALIDHATEIGEAVDDFLTRRVPTA
jgi:pimeloyl-ACP methyl ester carboxylesterase